MRVYEAESLIAAPPEQVWPVLVAADEWPRWSSGVTAVEGAIADGARLKVTAAATPGRAFPVTVRELAPPRRMVLRGGMPLGLFVGERTYTLAAEEGGTRFTMRETYTGPLAPLIFRTIPDLGPSFRTFADGLKQRVERP